MHPVRGQGSAHLDHFPVDLFDLFLPVRRTPGSWKEVSCPGSISISNENVPRSCSALIARAIATQRDGSSGICRGVDLDSRDKRLLQLADAQLVIAREAGFASWPRLKRHLERTGAVVEPPVPLHDAVRSGELAAVRAVLATEPPPWQTREAIQEAIASDRRDIVRELLAHHGWVDTAGRRFGRWGGGLHTALLLGRGIEMIEDLVRGGASIDARDRDGRTPLAIAVRTANDAAEATLRRAGASDAEVDELDRRLGACIRGVRPERGARALRRSDHQHLSWAIRRGHFAALPALLALGLDPDVPDDDGETPLHLAVAARSLAALDALLAAGARVDALDYRSATPLAVATRLGDDGLAARLVRAGAGPGGPIEPLELHELFEDAVDAVVAGQIDRLRGLLDREPQLVTARSLREHRATLLHYVGANGVEPEHQGTPPNAPAIAELILSRGADPNALALTYGGGPAQTTLYLAATSSHPEEAGVMVPLLEALVRGGARVNDEDRDALHTSQPSALPALVAAGATVDLWLAAALGRLADVRRFVGRDGALAVGAKIGSEATTPDPVIIDNAFREACSAGHRDIVEHLVDAGARLDSKDVVGFTGLHHAAWNDHLEVAQLLIARGAPLEAVTVYGGTVLGTLLWAIEHAPREHPRGAQLVELLLAAGAKHHGRPTGDPAVDAVLRRHA